MDLRQAIDWQMLVTQVWSCFCLCEVTIDCCVISISSLESNGSANNGTGSLQAQVSMASGTGPSEMNVQCG